MADSTFHLYTKAEGGAKPRLVKMDLFSVLSIFKNVVSPNQDTDLNLS